jgi:hypothetical protein
MKTYILLALALTLVAGVSRPATADQPLSAKQIIARADRARGNVEGIIWTADITSRENGETQHRRLVIKNRGVDTVAEFSAPAKVRGNRLVMLDRNMWFVKPGLHKPVPISPRQKLLGGAANGDIASTNYAGDYQATFVHDDTVEGRMCYVFDLKANDKKVTYDHIRYWIGKKRQLGWKAEFFSVTGRLLKTATFQYDNSIQTESGPQPFVSQMTIHDQVIKGNITTMVYSDVKPRPLPAATFNLNLMLR